MPGAFPHSFQVVEVGGSEETVLAEVTGAGPKSKVRLGIAVQVLEIQVLECDPQAEEEEEEEGPAAAPTPCEIHYSKYAPPPASELLGLKEKGDQIFVESIADEVADSALPPPALFIDARRRGGTDISGTYL